VGVELICGDSQTDGHEETNRRFFFRLKYKAPKNQDFSLKNYEAPLLGAFANQMQ
jgi:hypothetical protein